MILRIVVGMIAIFCVQIHLTATKPISLPPPISLSYLPTSFTNSLTLTAFNQTTTGHNNNTNTNTTILTAWPPAPYTVDLPSQSINGDLWFGVIGPGLGPADTTWLVAVITEQIAVYRDLRPSEQPSTFEWSNERGVHFWMDFQDSERPPRDFAIAVLSLFRFLVNTYNAALCTFVARRAGVPVGYYYVAIAAAKE